MQSPQQLTVREIRNELDELIRGVANRVARVNTTLRLLQNRFNESATPQQHLEDAMVVVDMCVDTLPHPYQGINDLWDVIDLKLYDVERKKNQDTAKIIKAMTITANPASSVEELTGAGMELYRLSASCAEHELHWKAWMEIMCKRGFKWQWPEFLEEEGVWRLELIAPGIEQMPATMNRLNAVAERSTEEKIETIITCLSSVSPDCLKRVLSKQLVGQ